MKTRMGLLLVASPLLLSAQFAPLMSQTITVLDRGPHEQVVQNVEPDGTTNTFTQLETGLNRWSDADKSWVSAVAVIERVNGSLIARQTQHQVIFGDTADAPAGTIDLLMVNGSRFRVRPTGIAYTEFKDGQPGRSAFVEELQSSPAQLTAPTEVTYVGALGSADLQYELSLAGLEQNVVFRQRLPRPQDLQMDPALVRVECWSEVLESPAPVENVSTVTRSDGSTDPDAYLNFGPMQINIGKSFSVGSAADTRSLRVAKQWQTISNSVWLIESAPYAELAPLVDKLPAQQASRSIDADKLKQLWAKESKGGRSRPVSLRDVRTADATGTKDARVASITTARERAGAPGVVLDFSVLSSATNFVFKGDSTYYCSGAVNLSSSGSGTTVIEGGTCVKFTNSTATARITITGPISCRTSAYRPAVFTSKDSDEIGEKITGSTGSPTNFYGQGLQFGGSNTLHDVRFAWLGQAVYLNSGGTLNLQDAQMVRCDAPLYGESSTTFNVENALCYASSAMISGTSLTITGWHWTLDQCDHVGNVSSTAMLFLTNSVLASVGGDFTDWGFTFTNRFVDDGGDTDPNTGTVKTPNSFGTSFGGSPFQTVGAGSHYLQSSNCPAQMHHTGTTNINPALLARLSRKTTYPPVVLTKDFTTNTTLSPIVPRDDDGLVDLGYHYDPIDYAWSGLNLTNSTLTLTNGAAVAVYGAKGTLLRKSATFISGGDPLHFNRIVRYQVVQEQPTAWGTGSVGGLFDLPANYSPAPVVRLTFTDLSVPAGAPDQKELVSGLNAANNTLGTFAASHSQLRGIYQAFRTFATGCTLSLTNNLMERSTLTFEQGYTGFYTFAGFSLSAYNNLLHGAPQTFKSGTGGSAWTIKDNLFDADSVTVSGTYNVTADYNGYRSGLSSLGGTHNKTIYNSDYQSSFLGDLYYPTSGTNLATLIDAGSRTASSAGLSSYTTQTNQVADGGAAVDIGQHYFAVSTNTTVTIQATIPIAVEPSANSGESDGQFTVYRTGSTSSNLTVYYTVGGSAVGGVDYDNVTNLTGTITIGTGNSSQNIRVVPFAQNAINYHKTVVAKLTLTNSYFVGSPGQATVTIQNTDPLSTDPVSVASITLTPTGIAYHPGNSSLIISRGDTSGSDKNFKRLNSSGVLSDWTSLSGLGYTVPGGFQGEIKAGIVQATANGWTQGDLYFGTGTPGKIGKVSADGSTVVSTNWATLTNATQMVGETDPLLGGFHVDRTGLFGGDLIVVSGSGAVWRVTSSTNATKFAQINDANGAGLSLEGALTLTNDVAKYGPWAGRILTCAEGTGLVYAIDTNGVAASYNLGPAAPEDVRLIPSGQPLYVVDENTSGVLKVAATNFASFTGDVLLVHESAEAGLFCEAAHLEIVHWDGARFITRRIDIAGVLEHATFAPVDIQ